jgi:monovalent cation/hydrogen antiporter
VTTVVAVRPLWLFLSDRGPGRKLHLSLDGPEGQALTWRELTVLSWSGSRGVITLAAVFAIPLTVNGNAFPGRSLVVFSAYLVVLVSLLGQGLTFAPLVRWCHLPHTEEEEQRAVALARSAIVAAGLQRLDQMLAAEPQAETVVEPLRRSSALQHQRAKDRLSVLEDGSEAADTVTAIRGRLRRQMIEAERDELLRWRDVGRLSDRGLRELQRELDYEEGILPGG